MVHPLLWLCGLFWPVLSDPLGWLANLYTVATYNGLVKDKPKTCGSVPDKQQVTSVSQQLSVYFPTLLTSFPKTFYELWDNKNNVCKEIIYFSFVIFHWVLMLWSRRKGLYTKEAIQDRLKMTSIFILSLSTQNQSIVVTAVVKECRTLWFFSCGCPDAGGAAPYT